ncbi:MAG: hypothetical protein K8S99_14300 [Planctomycetes bacterium]|nr:hypothetical protein [Planctomycetota bacterium]
METPPRSIARPPAPRDRLSTWVFLALILVMALPALLIDLQSPDVTDPREARSVLVALNAVGERAKPQAQFYNIVVPTLNDRVRWDVPPTVGWLLTAVLPAPSADGLWLFILGARLTSVVMGLVTIACVYWAGFSLGGLRTAAYAAAVCATGAVLVHQARLATPAIHFAAWATMSIAAALWALRPLKPQPSLWRQAIGWALCGLSMGLAALTIGPGAMLSVAMPVLFLTLLCPNRASHLLGLLAALLLSALVVLPWATFARQHDPDAWPVDPVRWVALGWIEPGQITDLLGHMLPLMIVALMPWTLWLVGAIVQPFSTSSAGVRRKLFLGWGWFTVSAVMCLLAPPVLRVAFLMQVIPAAAVLIAEVFTQYADLAATGRMALFWRLLRWVHMVGLATLSVALPLLVTRPEWFVSMGLTGAEPLANVGWFYAGPLMAALLAIVAYTARPVMASLPGRSLAFWTFWGAVALTAMTVPWARSPINHPGPTQEAERLRQVVGDQPLFWLGPVIHDPADTHPVLLLYGPRPVRVLKPTEIEAAQRLHPELFLLAPYPGGLPPAAAEFEVVGIKPLPDLMLYHWAAPPTPAQSQP